MISLLSRALFCLSALLIIAGCAKTPEIRSFQTTYQFQNVRSDDRFDEWPLIRRVLEANAKERVVQVAASRPRPVGNLTVRDYTARFVVDRIQDLNTIHARLTSLAERTRGPGGRDRVEFQLREATLGYGSNYVVAGIEIVVKGITDPRSRVVLLDSAGKPREVPVQRNGTWSTPVKVAPEQRYIIGYSLNPQTGVRKQFRIDIFTQRQETVEADPQPKSKAKAGTKTS